MENIEEPRYTFLDIMNNPFVISPLDNIEFETEQPITELNIQEKKILGLHGAKKLFCKEGFFIFGSLDQIANSLFDHYNLVVPFDVITLIAQFYVDTLLAEVNLVMEEDTSWFNTDLGSLVEGYHNLLNICFNVNIYGIVSGQCNFENQTRYFAGSFNGDGVFKIYGSFDKTDSGECKEIREYSGRVELNSHLYFIMTNKIMKTLSTSYLHATKIMKGKGTIKMVSPVKPFTPMDF